MIKKTVKRQLKIITITVAIILTLELKRGLNQTKGSINGPTQRKDTTRVHARKYHFSFV